MKTKSLLASFINSILLKEQVLFNETGMEFKNWMIANGMEEFATKPEWEEYMQQIIPILNDSTINTLTKKIFIYNYYWLSTTTENEGFGLSYLSSLAALLCNKSTEKLETPVEISDALKILYQASNPAKEEETIYSSNNDPSFVSAMDVLKSQNTQFPQELIMYDDYKSEITIETIDETGPYVFQVTGQTVEPLDTTMNMPFDKVQEKLSEQAEMALKIWLKSANLFIEGI